MSNTLTLHPADNVAVVVNDLDPSVPRGHKVALAPIAPSEMIIKYGHPIGHATAPIAPGEWVHTQNMATNLGPNLHYEFTPLLQTTPSVPANEDVINAYVRPDGEIGIRNELWVVPTVGCVNAQVQAIAQALKANGLSEGCDAIRPLTHPYGCSQLGDDHANTVKALCALLRHPNAGGIIVLGLGCENNQITALRQAWLDQCLKANDTTAATAWRDNRVRFITAQEVDDEVAAGIAAGQELLSHMASDRRQPVSASRLRIGLKCGGSDGLSGITANPLLGRISDLHTASGGTCLLTEVPEMFGAETLLMRRAASRKVFDKIVRLITDFKQYYRTAGLPIYENPSPGNKAGGITTLEEKSLGCVLKGGTSPVTDVLGYGERASLPGLNLLQAPGNDLVAASALALSGCHIVLFSTGRGTPLSTFVPTLKIATNTPLALRKPHWIDFDAGSLLQGETMPQAARRLWQQILLTASGLPTAAESAGVADFTIFRSGVTL